MTEEQINQNSDETYRLWQLSVKQHIEKMKSQIDYDQRILDIDRERYQHELDWYIKCCSEAGLVP